ncbi:MAG TPA: hypothetical protein VK358_11665, partial [Longimicrobium sp.]|nr:hypothetical protein [Longimicrobium sp.]
VSALRALVDDTRPSGKTPAVSEEQRASLRRVAHAVAVADERLADALLGLADASDPKLSRQQAQLLTNAGFAAAEELGVASTLVGDELPLEG